MFESIKTKILLPSFFIVMLLLIVTWQMIPINFETNDDSGIMGYITGARTGYPEADTIFSLYLWGRAVSALYSINGKVPWYILIFLSLICISLWVVCYCIMDIFHSQGQAVFMGAAVFLILYCSMFLYYSVLIQFTAVSAYCGIAAITLLQTYKYEASKVKRIVVNSIIFLLMFFSINIRSRVGYMVLGSAFCVVVMEFGYVFLCKNKFKQRNVLRNMIFSFSVMTAAVILSLAAHRIHESSSQWREFREFHRERSLYTDYEKKAYEDTEVYKNIGWSENLYDLTAKWFFMDESVDTHTFKTINEQNDCRTIKVSVILKSMFSYERMIGIQILMWGLVLLVCLYDNLIRGGTSGRQMIPFLWVVIWFLGIIFFANRGRIVRRVLESWTLLVVLPSIIEILQNNERIQKKTKRFEYVFTIVTCMFFVGMKNGLYCNASQVSKEIQQGKEAKEKVEHYVMDRPDNLYIYDYSLTYAGEPWSVYPDKKPYNLIFWGGAGYHSPLYYKQLQKNGFDHIYEEDFFRDNIFFMGQKDIDVNLLSFMKERYPNCVCNVVDKNELFVIYKFSYP